MKNKYNINKNLANVLFLVGVVFFIPLIKACSQTTTQDDLNTVRVKRQMDQYRADMREQRIRRNHFLDQAQSTLASHEADVYKEGDVLVIRLKGLTFPSSVSAINQSDYPLLSKVQSLIKKSGKSNVLIEGHADSLGDRDLNVRLSKKRALSVSRFFNKHKNGAVLDIETAGVGYQRPLATNTTPRGRARNRRVEIIIFSKNENSHWQGSETKREGWPLL